MRINKLRTKNFKSIYGEFELDLSQITGLWKIEGPVGTGKTTIGEAILYGLFGTIRSKTNGSLISWGTKRGQVELWVTSNSRELYIRREINAYGQSPTYVEVDGEELIFTDKRNAQSILEEEYYDTTRMMLEMLCIISFNNFKSLATLSTKDSRAFMNQVLGFEIFDQYCDAIKEASSTETNRLISIRDEIKSREQRIQDIQSHTNPECESLNQIYKDIKELNDRIVEETTRYNEARKVLDTDKRALEQHSQVLIATGKALNKDINLMKSGICPTCGQKIDDSKLTEKEKALSDIRSDYKKLQEQINAKTMALKKLDSDFTTIKSSCSKTMQDLNRRRAQQEAWNKYKDQDQKLIEQIESELVNLRNEEVDCETQIYQWSQLLDAVGGTAREHVLNQFIPTINRKIYEHVMRLHLPYIIQFDNKMQCKITHSIQNIEIPISSLSTGQLKTVDMSIILGVLSTLLGQSGINILFLDELFSNLDENIRNEVTSVLRQSLSPNNTMFIISHTPMNESLFDGTIQVRLQGSDVESRSIYEIVPKDTQKFDIKY